MNTETGLFSLFLLSVGVLLILFVRKALKEQALSQAHQASPARTPRPSAPRARRLAVARAPEQPATWELLSASSVRSAFEKFLPEDPWRSLTASRVSEAFEEFTRKP